MPKSNASIVGRVTREQASAAAKIIVQYRRQNMSQDQKDAQIRSMNIGRLGKDYYEKKGNKNKRVGKT